MIVIALEIQNSVLSRTVSILYSLALQCATISTVLNQAETKSRLSREAWLAKALDILAEDPEHLRIDELAERLGVSKGSFYWHFENRSDFVYAMAEFWREQSTMTLAEALSRLDTSAEDRVYVLMTQLLEYRAGRHDLAVRAWARHEPSILPVIREVDEIRIREVKDLFLEMGFDSAEAYMRARVFVTFHSLDEAMSIQLSRKEARAQLELRYAFFTRR